MAWDKGSVSILEEPLSHQNLDSRVVLSFQPSPHDRTGPQGNQDALTCINLYIPLP